MRTGKSNKSDLIFKSLEQLELGFLDNGNINLKIKNENRNKNYLQKTDMFEKVGFYFLQHPIF